MTETTPILRSEWPLYRYRGTLLRIVDGDTISVALDLGDHTYRTRRIRMLGFDAPEVVGTTRAAGLAAESALAELLPVGCRLYIATHLDRTNFDRLLGWVYADGEGDALVDIAARMIASGHGSAVT